MNFTEFQAQNHKLCCIKKNTNPRKLLGERRWRASFSYVLTCVCCFLDQNQSHRETYYGLGFVDVAFLHRFILVFAEKGLRLKSSKSLPRKLCFEEKTPLGGTIEKEVTCLVSGHVHPNQVPFSLNGLEPSTNRANSFTGRQ